MQGMRGEVENRNEMAKNYEIDDQNRRCSNLNYMHENYNKNATKCKRDREREGEREGEKPAANKQ